MGKVVKDAFPWLNNNRQKTNQSYTPEYHKFYNSRSWKKLRDIFISEHALCVKCEKAGRYVKATVVDHIKSVRNYPELRLNWSNLQPLCDYHHRQKTKLDHTKFSDENIQKGKELMNKLENKTKL